MNNPIAQAYNYVIFPNKIDVPTIWVKERAAIRKEGGRKRATSIAERVIKRTVFAAVPLRAASVGAEGRGSVLHLDKAIFACKVGAVRLTTQPVRAPGVGAHGGIGL